MATRGTINLDKIKYDPSIYPREKWKTSAIDEYADAMRGGADFPALILENGTNRLLDGVHRWKAYLKYRQMYAERQVDLFGNGDWKEPKEEIEVEWHDVPDGVPVKLFAASFSTNHGERISTAERKALAREIYQQEPDFTLEVLREYLGISIGSAHDYVADILARRKEQQKTVAMRLSMLGWTSAEIGSAVSLSESRVRELSSDFSDLKKSTKNLLQDGHPHLDVSERYNIPLTLTWAIDLEGRTDTQRMERLGINVQPYDVWHFSKCHDLFGSQHPGRIPGDLIAHVLYFYTQPGAKVIDPMVGSGTTLDVCLAFGRECYGYDIDERHDRPDVIRHDMANGWPERVKKADLIFWDPPYYKKMDSRTIGDDGYIENSISKMSQAEYLNFFEQRLSEAHQLVKPGTKLAFLMSDWDGENWEGKDGEGDAIFIWHYANIIQSAGWNLIRHIQTPLSTQQVHPDIVNKFRASRRLARLERYLLIAEK